MSVTSPNYDLIRLDENVGEIWFGTANTFAEAFEAIRKHASIKPGKYMVYSQSAGSKAIFQATSDEVIPLNGMARKVSGS
jgi:hypothetical protein